MRLPLLLASLPPASLLRAAATLTFSRAGAHGQHLAAGLGSLWGATRIQRQLHNMASAEPAEVGEGSRLSGLTAAGSAGGKLGGDAPPPYLIVHGSMAHTTRWASLEKDMLGCMHTCMLCGRSVHLLVAERPPPSGLRSSPSRSDRFQGGKESRVRRDLLLQIQNQAQQKWEEDKVFEAKAPEGEQQHPKLPQGGTLASPQPPGSTDRSGSYPYEPLQHTHGRGIAAGRACQRESIGMHGMHVP